MSSEVARQIYPFSLPELPYAYDALEPHIDRQTLELHHRAHHATYVKKLNDAVAKAPELQRATLIDLLTDVGKLPDAVRSAIVDNGGGHLNHDLFWNTLAPAAAPEPGGALAEALQDHFGSFADFRKRFSDAAAAHFASGWIALALDHESKKLEILSLKDHTVLPPDEKTALAIIDVWEHAYYLKYQNRRPEFIDAFWKVVNWGHVEEKYSAIADRPRLERVAQRVTPVGNF